MLASHHGSHVQPQGQLGLYSEMHLKQQQDQTINVSEGTAGTGRTERDCGWAPKGACAGEGLSRREGMRVGQPD